MITGGQTTVYVSDMDRAVEFYTKTLGLRLALRAGNHFTMVDAGIGVRYRAPSRGAALAETGIDRRDSDRVRHRPADRRRGRAVERGRRSVSGAGAGRQGSDVGVLRRPGWDSDVPRGVERDALTPDCTGRAPAFPA